MAEWLAHLSEDGRTQTVTAHLEGTAALAEQFAAVFGGGPLGRAAGLAHDIGKFSPDFQRRILHQGPKVDHSTAGAVEAARLGMDAVSCAVAGHHTGLPDGGNLNSDTPDMPTLYGRIKRGLAGGIPNYSAWREQVRLAAAPPPVFCGKDPFDDAFFIRMLYSALVDADYLDTERFMSGGTVERGGYDGIPVLLERLEEYISPWWGSDRPINQARCRILRACLNAGDRARGLFTLTVPTGGGKTVSSLAFALRHAAAHKMPRIIYVIPYTSIIEQTAQKFREILGANNVLEHHSGVSYEADEGASAEELRKAHATENWDAPIVVTTAVQFFESLYASRSSRCRKLHNIAQSVVIFDEAQMLPLPYLQPCVAAIAQLVAHYGVSAVLCTATQPALDPLFRKFLPAVTAVELAPDPGGLYDFFRRVTLEQLGPLSDEALARRLNGHEQVLCIVNSRQQAQEVYARLTGEGNFHLSTLMYPAHRRAVLNQVRARLDAGLPCRVVSTSLIEAGVDVDFPTVYRAEAGLDSVLQAAGRCNRENRRPRTESFLYVFRPEKPPPPLFGVNIAAARETAARYPDHSTPEAISCYFRTLYTLNGSDALDQQGILDAFRRGIAGCLIPFSTVANRFHLIDTQTKTVYIPLDEGGELTERLQTGGYTRALSRQLGQYAVNVYPQHFQTLADAGDLEILDENTAILTNPTLYSPFTGLSLLADEGKGLFA